MKIASRILPWIGLTMAAVVVLPLLPVAGLMHLAAWLEPAAGAGRPARAGDGAGGPVATAGLRIVAAGRASSGSTAFVNRVCRFYPFFVPVFAKESVMLRFTGKLIAASMLVAALAGGAFAQTGDAVQPYVSHEGGFRVMFPGEPKLTTRSATTASGAAVEIHFLTLEKDHGKLAYLVVYGDLPAADLKSQNAQGVTDTDRLNNALKGFMATFNGKVTSQKWVELAGVTGKEVDFQRPDGTQGVYRNYIANGRIYQVIVGWKGGQSGRQRIARLPRFVRVRSVIRESPGENRPPKKASLGPSLDGPRLFLRRGRAATK